MDQPLVQPMLRTLSASLLSTAMATTVHASDEIAELRALVQDLQAQINALKAPLQTAAEPAPATATRYVEAGDLPGSFKLPGSDISIKLYGHVRFDSTYDIKGRQSNINSTGWANSLFVQPLDRSAAGRRHGQTYATARGSRFGFMASMPTGTDAGPLLAKLEGDFDGRNDLGGETQTSVRLREAYVKLGGLLVGQSWSTFVDLRAVPEMVEWNSTGIVPNIRQAMLRYGLPLGENGRVELAVENSIGNSWSRPPNADFDTGYDLVARYDHNTAWGHFSLRGVSVQYENDRHDRRGYGLAASARVNLGASDSIVLLAAGGEGIGRYLYNGLVQQAVATDEGIRLWKGWGAHLGYTHKWSDILRSTAAVAYTRFTADETANAAQLAAVGGPLSDFAPNRELRQIFLSTLWSPYRNVDVGLDYTYGQRETFQDDEGTISRLSAMMRYRFE
ncbi:DcaP family trimeric outer membrane transporter [Thauera sp.]|uniref:DcaP family trimeric outer membrane transporter n=1 Tax=Thauera sp. TaxID=1905334 RepID=UPI0039E35919